jgi:hypothetical protein
MDEALKAGASAAAHAAEQSLRKSAEEAIVAALATEALATDEAVHHAAEMNVS